MTSLGFDASFLLLLGAGVLGAVLRVVLSTTQSTLSRETLGDALVGGLTSYVGLPALALVPVVKDVVAKLDSAAEQGVAVLAIGYIASHVWTTVARQRVPRLLERVADRFGGAAVVALMILAAAPAQAQISSPGGGSSGGGTQYNEDAAHSSGDTGTMALTVRKDTAAATSGTDGDYQPLITDANGRLHTKEQGISAAAALADNTANPTVGGIQAFIMCWDGSTWDRCLTGSTSDTEDGTIAGGQSSVALTVGFRYEWDGTDYNRPAAHDEADTAGAPYKIGARATTSISGGTMVATADLTHLYAGIDGVLITRPHSNLEDRVSAVVGVTDGSSTSLVASQGAGLRFCATTLIVSNSSATNVTVDIRDGTAGSVIATIPAAANMGGAVVPLATPLCTSAATAMAMDPSAAASTVTVTAIGFKTKL
jgi:hypothetical protein